MFKAVPFHSSHLEPLLKEEINGHLTMGPADVAVLESSIFARTGLWENDVVIIGGVTQYWPGRGQLWTIFSEKTKANFLPIYRMMQDFMREQPCERLEMCVPCDFEQGHRRARMLGFHTECERARWYLPGQIDATLYSYLKES